MIHHSNKRSLLPRMGPCEVLPRQDSKRSRKGSPGKPQFWPFGSNASGGEPTPTSIRKSCGSTHVSALALATPIGRSPLRTTPLERA